MGLSGWGSGGSTGQGPSRAYYALPFQNYQSISTWVEEWIDAMGLELDVVYNQFIKSTARANLLDPTFTPSNPSTAAQATATSAPTGAVSKDTMLDVIAFIALGLYPLDSNLTVSQKQSLVQTGWNALRRKGNRIRLLELAAKISDGVALGWTVPPFNFSIILPDGAPSPGYGTWVQPTSSTSETSRPWILPAVRNTLANIAPSFINLGIGYSQFRAGCSSAGETVFASGARINVLTHEHFDAWNTGVPTGWTKTGTGTLTQSTSDTSINWEFTGNAAVLDLTAAASGAFLALAQTALNINNQLTHRLQLDYKYTNAQNVSTLTIQITDTNPDGNTYYWNPTTSTWNTTAYAIAVPPSTTRARYACDIVPQSSSSTASTCSTTGIGIKVLATSDGTATTQTTYTLYRVGLYEKFSLALETAAYGELTANYPLVDSPGWTTSSRSAVTGTILEPATADRSKYKLLATSTQTAYPYHAAISGRGFRASTAWTNLIKGSNDFGVDWTLTNATKTANANVSPAIGDSSTAPTLTATATGASIQEATGVTPTSKSYVGGIWVKKLSTDVAFTDVTLSLVSTSTQSVAYTLKQSQGWQLLPITATFGGGDVAALSFKVAWGAASSSGQIAVADAYLYDVTGKTGVLYPPVIRSGVGATGILTATKCQALTASQGVNVLNLMTQRTLASVVRGSMSLTVVPTFDASSQPSGVIFDLAQGAAQNRVVLRVNAGALELKRWDNAGNTWTASLTLSANPSPASGSMTWLRDTAIAIRCVWDENSTQLAAGGGNASGTKPGSWAPSDTSVASLTIGEDYTHLAANCFDGVINGLQVTQLGAAVS